MAANFAGLLIVLPTRARKIAPYDTLNRKDVGAPHQHRTAAQFVFMPPNHLGHLIDISGKQMMRNYLCELCEPEARKRSKHFPFSFDRGGEYAVEGRDAVGSNDQQASVVDFIDIANFAPANKFEIGELGFNYWGDGGHLLRLFRFLALTVIAQQLRQYL